MDGRLAVDGPQAGPRRDEKGTDAVSEGFWFAITVLPWCPQAGHRACTGLYPQTGC